MFICRMLSKPVMFLMLAVIFLTAAVTVHAESAFINTEVPYSHLVSVDIIGKGTVTAGGSMTDNGFVVERHNRQKYTFTACDGYRLERVIYDGEDITGNITEDIFTADGIDHDICMTVIFTPIADTPHIHPDSSLVFVTGEDRSLTEFFIAVLFLSAALILYCSGRERPV